MFVLKRTEFHKNQETNFMQNLKDITLFLDSYLENNKIADDSWNGLQISSKKTVNKVALAVTAGMETFERAKDVSADLIIVHHGMFWRSANPSITRWDKDRIKFLLDNEISLYASHLPLDKHPEVGHNAQLLKILGFKKESPFGTYAGQQIGFIGKSESEKSLEEIEKTLETEIGAKCKTLAFGKKDISSIAVISGGGDNFGLLFEAIEAEADLYLTGDSTEMYHIARDAKINVVFAGHHATETVGLIALADVLGEEFDIETVFIDVPTGL